jgi:hypothetical protein
MLQELLYLGPEQRLKRQFSNFQDANRAIIDENALNQTANQKKALEVRFISGHK